ncbi:MAG: NAD(P)/FAD-dependent oxidoreductase [Bacteroidales bacterium]|nr:NAD(P)/FAD-dependent oxidoreductase [Bacteroidales bacterium]
MKEFEISCPVGKTLSEEQLYSAAAKALGVARNKVASAEIVRRSLDARNEVLYRYRISASAVGETIEKYTLPEYKFVSGAEPVIVVGSGPAGMFASLRLLMEGRKPIILERGKDVHSRKFDIASIGQRQIVNPDSNYCFGEGGAGTFSDGKLFTRSNKRGDIREVLRQLVSFGADESILTDAHPHIGSDKLPRIVENIRKCIIEHGGEYHFDCKVIDLEQFNVGNKKSWKVICEGGLTFSAKNVILATGHSAKEIYRLFARKGWALEMKGFAIGVRAEHPQSLINKIQYHGKYQPFMPPAEYSLVTQVEGRGVFSFCMCPGGILVPSSTEPSEVVLNGMSNSMRNSQWANAGIVCSVEAEDVPEFDKYGVFALLEFQQSVEHQMFDFSNSLQAPAQRMTDFCRKIVSSSIPKTSYTSGAVSAPLHELLPLGVYSRLRAAFPAFDRKMKGFYTDDALLLACESRTSSPIRIPRNQETMCHVDLPGIYPCGEGAGYAGGIVSSAIDGILVASSTTA